MSKPIQSGPCWKAKPCPFCGWVPNYRKSEYGVHFIECEAKCGVQPKVTSTASRDAALRRWNRRSHG